MQGILKVNEGAPLSSLCREAWLFINHSTLVQVWFLFAPSLPPGIQTPFS